MHPTPRVATEVLPDDPAFLFGLVRGQIIGEVPMSQIQVAHMTVIVERAAAVEPMHEAGVESHRLRCGGGGSGVWEDWVRAGTKVSPSETL